MKNELKNKPLYVSSIEFKQNPPNNGAIYVDTINNQERFIRTYTLTIELEDGHGVTKEHKQDLADTIGILQKCLGPQYEKGNGHRITNASDVPWVQLISMRDETKRIIGDYKTQLDNLHKASGPSVAFRNSTPIEKHYIYALTELENEIKRRINKAIEYVEKTKE